MLQSCANVENGESGKKCLAMNPGNPQRLRKLFIINMIHETQERRSSILGAAGLEWILLDESVSTRFPQRKETRQMPVTPQKRCI